MPIYEYQCQDCKVHYEKRRSISEGPLLICEKCGGRLEKQVSLSGFQFKGEGWYVTDYAAKKAPAGEKSEASEKTEKDSSGKSAEKHEKSTTGESTSKMDNASNKKSHAPAVSKTENTAKKE